MNLSHLSQYIADVPISDIAVFAFLFTFFRLVLIRITTSAARAFAEVIEAALIAAVLVFMIVQPFLFKSFYIPSGSMLPTLIDDDHIVVNKLEYRLEKPHDGDVAVFVAPERAIEMAPPEENFMNTDHIDYIKRLMGVAGDVIQTKYGYITIDGQQQTHSDIRRVLNLDDHDKQHVRIEANDVEVYDGRWERYGPDQIARDFSRPDAVVTFHPGVTIRNGKVLAEPYTSEDPSYTLKICDGRSVIFDPDGGGYVVDGVSPTMELWQEMRFAPAGPIPPGHVFMMGDNRNDSNDSTRWGPLPVNALIGKADIIFWPIGRVRPIR